MLINVNAVIVRLLSATFSRKQIPFVMSLRGNRLQLVSHGKFRKAYQEMYIFSSPACRYISSLTFHTILLKIR